MFSTFKYVLGMAEQKPRGEKLEFKQKGRSQFPKGRCARQKMKRGLNEDGELSRKFVIVHYFNPNSPMISNDNVNEARSAAKLGNNYARYQMYMTKKRRYHDILEK
ncbi:hypothetical protein EAE96_010693 [Botrytis aclada]|nr:hypothetical protein EAE96_010693 [Botrytis aclada]